MGEDIADITKKLDNLLSAFVFSSGMAFRLVENVYFIKFVNLLCKINFEYKPMCRQTLAKTCLYNIHDIIVEQKKLFLQNTPSVLMADGWKNSVANKKYFVFGLSNIHLPMAFLGFADISLEREDGETLRKYFNTAIDYAKATYGTDVYAINTDNDSTIVCGGRQAISADGKKMMQVTCLSHSSHLFMKDTADPDFVKDMREIISNFRDTTLQNAVKKLGGSKIKTLSETRFGYVRDICECLLNNFKYFKQVADDDRLVEKIKPNVLQKLLDEDFEQKMKELVKLFTPVCKFMNKCQDPRFTIAEATQFWLQIKLPIENYSDLNKNFINNTFNARTEKALKSPMLAANLLHPQYQGSLLTQMQKDKAMQFLNETLNDVEQAELTHYFRNKNSFAIYKENCSSAIDYWTWCSFTLPNLSKFVITLLLIPASTAQLEGVFSQWQFIHNDYKGNMSNETSGSLIDIYHTLKYINFEDGSFIKSEPRKRKHLEIVEE